MAQTGVVPLPKWWELITVAINIAFTNMKSAVRLRRIAEKDGLRQASQLAQFLCILNEKMESNPHGELHKFSVVCEEMRFFFGAEAVVIFNGKKCAHRNLASREFEVLSEKMKIAGYRDAAEYQVLDIAFNEQELADTGGNDNLKACNRLVAARHSMRGADYGIWLWLPVPSNGFQEESPCWLFEAEEARAGAQFFDQVFQLLGSARFSTFWRVDSEALLKLELPTRYHGKSDFLEQYRTLFLPLDSILEPLRQLLIDEVSSAIKGEKGDVSCAFSIRVPDEDAVHFYVTAAQAEAMVQTDGDVEILRKFCECRYRAGAALSGWVLETTSCLYVENFTQSGLWTRYISNDGDPDPERSAQRNRVGKFLGRGNAFLLPVLMEEVQYGPEGQAPRLSTVILLSITVNQSLSISDRRRIYQLVQRLGSAVAVALGAQGHYASFVKRSVVANNILPLTRFISHELKNHSNYLSQKIVAGTAFSGEVAANCNFVIKDIGSICMIAESYHKYLGNGNSDERLEMESVTDLRRFVNEAWNSSWNELERRSKKRNMLDTDSKVENIPGAIRIHKPSVEILIRNLLINAVNALGGVGNGNGRIRLRVQYLHKQKKVRFSVSDNGPGMTEDTQRKLLAGQRISKVAGTDNDKSKSDFSGYGWYFIRLFSEAHGATLSLSDNDGAGRGCVVNVDFPLEGGHHEG